VLFRHKDHSDFIPESNESLPGIEKINLLHSSGHRIVLTTARSKKFKSKLVKLLNVKGVKYDELVMGLPSGPRVLVNDRKPKKPFTKQATSVEISRNGDLSSFNIDDILQGNKTKIVSDLSGNSFAKTYLLSNEGNIFVRKHIIKTSSSKPHCQTLKRQKSDLERLNFLSEDICPKVLREIENEIEYYYDMEFLPSYVQISDLTSDNQSKVLNKVLHKLENEIYIMSKSVNGQEWMENFLNLKIYPKFDSFSLKNDSFYSIINSDLITINGKSFFGLRKVFRMLDYDRLCPSQIGVVHGDLTFENILYNEKSKDVKLIDMDGSRMYDARELDLGKLSQSVFSNYKMWSKSDSLINKINPSKGHYECVGDYFNSSSKIKDELVKKWSEILNQPIEEVENKAMFYMSTYFIRFVPFRLQISQEHGIFALLMATAWLNKVLEKQNENE
jgi:thiamine kinase-like enzyme